MKRILKLAGLSLLLAMGLSQAAHADTIYFALDQPTQTANPGDVVSFTAQIAEIQGNYFFLNGDTFSVEGSLAIDDTGLFVNFEQVFVYYDYEDFELFTVTLPLNTPTGTYLGSFSLYGGSGSNASDLLGTQNFSISTVNTSLSGVPEPPSLLLLGSGLIGISAVFSRRQWRRNENPHTSSRLATGL